MCKAFYNKLKLAIPYAGHCMHFHQNLLKIHINIQKQFKPIRVGRFRILGGGGGGGDQGLEYWGGQGGPNSQQAHDVIMTSMRCNDVASTSFRRHVPNRFLINQCQIITFHILKYDIIENSRIELRGIVLPVQVGGLLGGPKGMLAPPGPPLFLHL